MFCLFPSCKLISALQNDCFYVLDYASPLGMFEVVFLCYLFAESGDTNDFEYLKEAKLSNIDRIIGFFDEISTPCIVKVLPVLVGPYTSMLQFLPLRKD